MPDFKNIIIHSLESVQDMFDSSKSCAELFGYDFMIDEEMKSWLIEINSSPTMEASTVSFMTSYLQHVTKDLCAKV